MLFVWAALVLSAAALPVRADEAPPRAAVVREMLNCSRLLKDARFTVPLEYYRRCLRRLAEQGGAESRPPVDRIDELASYRLEIPADRRPRLAVRRRIRILRPDRGRPVPVLAAKWSWEKVTIDGKPGELIPLGGWLCIVPSQAGTVEIAAELSLKKAAIDGGEVVMEVRPAVRNLLQVDSPHPWQVRAVGAVGRLKGTAEAGTHGQLALQPGGRLLVTFNPPPPQYERPPRYELKGQIAWNFDAAAQQVSARLLVAVADGRSDRIELLLPPQADRLTVTGPDVREVRASRGRALVYLRRKISGPTWLQVQYELPKRQGGVQGLGRLAVRDGHWTGGTLVVTNTAGGNEVVPESTVGLEDMALVDIPESAAVLLAGQAVLAYRIKSRNWSAKVDLVDLGQGALRETIADIAHYDLLLRGDGAVMCKATFEIRNRTRQFLRLELPPGAIVLAARVNEKSRPMAPVPGRPGVYLLPLERSTASVEGLVSFPVEVVAMYRVGPLKGNERTALPVPQIDLPIAYAWAELRVPDGMSRPRWSGLLHRVDEYAGKTARASLGYGRGEKAIIRSESSREVAITAATPTPGIVTASISKVPTVRFKEVGGEATALLARNYYRAGQDSYDKADYADAARAFRKVVQLAPDSSQADNARLYLANPILPGEETRVKSRSQRAALSQVRQDIAAANVKLLERQRGFLEKGRQAAHKGKKAEALEQFEAAQAMSKKLVARGESRRDQKALLREADKLLVRGRAQKKAEISKLAGEVEHLRSAGRYVEALDRAKKMRIVAAYSQDTYGDKRRAVDDEEIEELALKAARQHSAKPGGEGGQATVRKDATRLPATPIPDFGRTVPRVNLSEALAQAPALKPPQFQRRAYRVDDDANKTRKLVEKLLSEDSGPGTQTRQHSRPVATTVTVSDGSLVVTAPQEQQEQVGVLLKELDAARGPQVELSGSNIAAQRARGLIKKETASVEEGDGKPESGYFAGTSTGYRLRRAPSSAPRGSGVVGRVLVLGDVSTGGLFQQGGRSSDQVRRIARDKQFQEFVRRNYSWAFQRRGGRAAGAGGGQMVITDLEGINGVQPLDPTVILPQGQGGAYRVINGVLTEIARKAGLNLGQKVAVNSINLNVDQPTANGLGIRFTTGNNDVSFTVIDEAQMRTLLELDARRSAAARVVGNNGRLQDTIVGTEALLANGWAGNVKFAGERFNMVDLRGNPVRLEHEKYLLINNGSFMTAVRAGRMQYWTEQAKSSIRFAEVSQTLDVPRVGRVVKLEKRLVKPTDRLVIRCAYVWKGATE